ncbi:hypothetical protein [Vulcaniibacterium tengchongense]|uniref:Uncharacterized protein n=1 Tax=Vulcaniibacterium tengchongense TaxID=1273429 RepID=A0A3N4V6G3_9GAMM|nr:hypothetical protein [Vulcaniibacterium tengchongense]RPE76925.1 hypothetical protein EDC50_2177 [Vulcaniibacterium tengchongense]
MSKRRGDRPDADEVHTGQGELRKPMDRGDQPGQGAGVAPPDDGRMRDLRRDPVREPRRESPRSPPDRAERTREREGGGG